MLTSLVFAAVLLSAPASAQEPGEVRRQQAELQLAATRGAWGGVERAYTKLVEARVMLDAEVHLSAARAAQERGDAAETRERVQAALHEEPDNADATAWMHALDSTYGRVQLLGDHRVHRLETEQVPFAPALQAAIRYAIAAVDEDGSFEGLLPAGTYQFGGRELVVRPGITTLRVDLRSDRTIRRQEREERREGRP